MPKKEYKKPDNKVLINLIHELNGSITDIAKHLKVSRGSVYNWIRKSPELKAAHATSKEITSDWVRSKLFERIEGVYIESKGQRIYKEPPNITAIIFYLKTQAGWTEKKPHDDNNTAQVLQGLTNMVHQAAIDYPDI